MKRYLVFGYQCYYPRGGMLDATGNFDSKGAAIEFAMNQSDEYYQVIDTQDMSVVCAGPLNWRAEDSDFCGVDVKKVISELENLHNGTTEL